MNIYNKKKHKIDLLILWAWLFIAPALSTIFAVEYFWSIVIFFILPSLYLSCRNPGVIKKSALFALLVGIPLVTVLDYMMEVTGSMLIPQSIFGDFRILGHVAVDSYIWGFFFLYLVVMYYETFLNHHFRTRLHYPNMKYLLIGMIVLLSTFFFVYFTLPEALHITYYFYFFWGLLLVLTPVVLLLTRYPRLIAKFFKAGAFFFLLFFGYELTAIAQQNWLFPGEEQFIGIVEIFGRRFPVEEMFYFIILGAFVTLTWYEFFDDDKK